MNIPLYYIVKNFFARKLTTTITILGIAAVVFVFAVVLMMADGINATLAATGSPNNVIVTRKSSTGEITSIIDKVTADNILTLPGISKTPEGKPIATTDGVAVINLTKKTGGLSNITVRGVGQNVFMLRPLVKVIEGRMFSWGSRELVVGSSIAERFNGAALGQSIKLAGDSWKIVGIIDGGGSGFTSEIWCDIEQVQQALNRTSFSTLTFRTDNPENISTLKMQFSGDPRLNQFEPEIETVYFAKQSEMLATFIRGLGGFITVIFSIGAMIGAMITMYAAVANRTAEIGTLRAIGFQKYNILVAFLLESIFLSVIGGALGLFIASFLQFLTISTLNFGSFSELAFSFALTPTTIITTLIFSVVMGVVGGVLPSIRASRLNIVSALRG